MNSEAENIYKAEGRGANVGKSSLFDDEFTLTMLELLYAHL